jgi:SAM-dependent methyltransferase
MMNPAVLTAEDDCLHFADDTVFHSVRDLFLGFGFNETNVRDQYWFSGQPGKSLTPHFLEIEPGTASGLDVLVHLFMGEQAVPVDDIIRILGSRHFLELQELKLVEVDEQGSACSATVRIEPVNELLICADRSPAKPPVRSDAVYRPWDISSQLYSRIVPPTPCKTFLEMCCGSAYVCLNAAQNFAESVCGVDINPRAIRFADFNKKLNGIENVATYCGNLFQPLQSRRFDRIVAHPPYVPAVADSLVYKHGGQDGERISADLISGIPHHLADGGEFHGFFAISDRIDAPAELRVRELLGPDGQELDVALLTVTELSLVWYLSSMPGLDAKGAEELRESCKKLGITRFVTAAVTIRSRRGSTPSTFRHRALGWQTAAAMADPHTFTH